MVYVMGLHAQFCHTHIFLFNCTVKPIRYTLACMVRLIFLYLGKGRENVPKSTQQLFYVVVYKLLITPSLYLINI